MTLLLSQIQEFLRSLFFVELCKIFALSGIVIFIMVLIVYPIFLNIVYNIKKYGRDLQ